MKTIKSRLKHESISILISIFTIDCKPTWKGLKRTQMNAHQHINRLTSKIISSLTMAFDYVLSPPFIVSFQIVSHISHISETSHTSHTKRNQYIIILSFNFKWCSLKCFAQNKINILSSFHSTSKWCFIKMFHTKTKSIHYHHSLLFLGNIIKRHC